MLFVHVSSQKDGPAKADAKRKENKKRSPQSGHQKSPLLHPCVHLVLRQLLVKKHQPAHPERRSEVKKKTHRVSTQVIRNLFHRVSISAKKKATKRPSP